MKNFLFLTTSVITFVISFFGVWFVYYHIALKPISNKNVIVNVLQKPGIYAIFLKEKKVLIGCINLKFRNSSNLAVRDSEAELGFWIGEPFWKNGFAVEACILILRY